MYSVKKVFLNIFQCSQENTYVGVSNLNRCVFLWTLQNCQEDLFWSTPANDCFYIPEIQTTNNVIYTLAKNFIFNFRIYKIFSYLLSFRSTEFPFAFAFFLHTISNISCYNPNTLFSCSLNRLNAFSHYQKLVPIGIA